MSVNLERAKIELQILEKKLEILNIQEQQSNFLKKSEEYNEEYQINFSNDGYEAVEQILKLLNSDNKYIINYDKWYEVWDINSKYNIVIENYNDVEKAYRGLITTGSPTKIYSVKANEIIREWDKYDKSCIRKQYDYRGKNIKKTLEIIDIILS